MTFALAVGLLAAPAGAALAGARAALGAWTALPSELDLPAALPAHSVMYAADGSVIATFYSENRIPVRLADVSGYVIDAIVATEDARFFDHHGVDWAGTARALWNNARGLPQQGGSGITQQYVKNVLIAQATTAAQVAAAKGGSYARKVREARYALALEATVGKDQILENYLNTVYFGDGAYGIGAAARHFFSVDAADLTLPQAALLAGLVNNPSAFDPTRNPSAAADRRRHVLARMADEGYITAAQAAAASRAPVGLDLAVPANGCAAGPFPLYCQWVRTILETDPAFGATPEQRQALVYRGGLAIRTALDPRVQRAAEAAARDALSPSRRIATAIAVVRPGTGRVVALATNKAFGQGPGQTELLLPVRAKFQNGSTFKPLTAAAALEAGVNPTLVIAAGATYVPANGRNYPDGGFHNAGDGPGGTMDMAGALRRSVNTWFVELEDRIGVLPVARVARAMGLASLPVDGPGAITEKDAALTLGAWDTSPLQVASAYATLAGHGLACAPIAITSATGPDGRPIPVPRPGCRQAIRPSTADTVTGMLVGVIEGADGTGYRARLDGDRPAAGKTGSTNDYGAAWFAGFTADYAAAVWVGDPRGPQYNMSGGIVAYGQPVRPVYGGTVPALIWKATMDAIHEGRPVRPLARPGGEAAIGMTNVIPDVRGLAPADASRLLAAAGFEPVLGSEPGPDIPGLPPGTVTGTVPAPGTPVAVAGRPVTMLVR